MKSFVSVLMVCLLGCGGLMLGGCGLFGPSVQKAQEIYTARDGEMAEAMTAWKAAAAHLTQLDARWAKFQADWKAAESAGDENALKGLLAQGQLLADEGKVAAADLKAAEGAYKATKNLFDTAAADLKSAKSTSDYVGTVLGYIGLGITTLLGGGGIARLVDNKKLKGAAEENETLAAAARITAANAASTFSANPTAWQTFLKAQEDKMAMVPGAREAFRAARS